MRPPKPRLRRTRPALPVLSAPVLALALALGACGADDAAPPVTEPASDTDPGATADQEDVDAPEEDADTLEEGFDEALGDASLDLIASAADSGLTSVTGYEIDGTAITLLDDGSSADPTLVCTVAATTLGSFDVPEGTTLTVRYPDGSSEECAL